MKAVCNGVAKVRISNYSVSMLVAFAAVLVNPIWAAPLIEGEDARIVSSIEDTVIREALSMGLPEADAMIVKRLQSDGLTEPLKTRLLVERMALAIQMNDWVQAGTVYTHFPVEGAMPNVRRLLRAQLHWGEREFEEAADLLDEVEPRFLSGRWLAWYWTLNGMLLEQEGRLGVSTESYNTAYEYVEPAQRPFLDLLMQRNKIVGAESNIDDSLITEMQIQIREFAGQAIAHQFAEQLIILYIRGAAYDDAIELIESRREFLVLPRDQAYADRLFLFEALITEARGEGNAGILIRLLESGNDARTLMIALEMLVANSSALNDETDVQSLLTRWSEQLPSHPIRLEILNKRAMVSLLNEDFTQARVAAMAIVENYPGSGLMASATEILGWVDWKEERYRSAAVWFEQVMSFNTDPGAAWRLSAAVADAYFMAGDFEIAASNYVRALESLGNDPSVARNLEYQRILSLLSAGQYASAMQRLDSQKAMLEGNDGELLWRLEWNLAVILSRLPDNSMGQARVANLLQDPSMPESLRLRFQWLNVRLLFDLGRYDAVIQMVDERLDQVENSTNLEAEVAAELNVLRARASLESGESLEIVIEDLAAVREKFGGTAVAPETLWIAGRALAEVGEFIEAEEAMNQLANDYPNTDWARLALFESASLAESREDYQQAAARLETFVQQSPTDPMAFYARLNQADLLRKIGRFDEAKVLLEGALVDFSEHPEQYLAQMIRADLLASEKDPARLSDAASAYARILDLRTIPADLQLEARYKLGKVYEGMGETEAAFSEWLQSTLIYENDENAGLTTGAYWVSRGLFEIARLSEEAQNIESAILALERMRSLELPGQAAVEAALRRLRSPLLGLNSVTP